MSLEFRLRIDAKSLTDFKVGVQFTKDDLLKYDLEYSTPGEFKNWNFKTVTDAFSKNVNVDYDYVKWWLKTRFTKLRFEWEDLCDKTNYVVSQLKYTKNFMYVCMIAASPVLVASAVGNVKNYDNTKTEVISRVVKENSIVDDNKAIKKSVERKKKKVVKQIKKETKELNKTLADLGIEQLPIRKIVRKNGEQKFSINPNETKLWETKANDIPSGTYVGKFSDNDFKVSTKEQHRRLVAVYNYFKKIEDDYQINALVAAGQFGVETANGQSRLINMGNNVAGCKEFREGYPFLRAHDDGNDLDETGKSRFRKYHSIEDGLLDYAGGVISKPLYKNARANYKNPEKYLYYIQHLAWDKKRKKFIRYADNDTYISSVTARMKLIKKLANQ